MSDDIPTTFDRAIWWHIWCDILAGLRSGSRWAMNAVAGLVTFGIAYFLLGKYGSVDASLDLSVEKLLAVPASVVVMMVFHGLWSWATAPRKIFAKHQCKNAELKTELQLANLRIAELTDSLEKSKQAKLEIIFNKVNHNRRFKPAEREIWITLYRIGVRVNSGTTKTIPRVSAKLKRIEPLSNKNALRTAISHMQEVPLAVTHDRDRPLNRSFPLDPGDIQSIDVIEWVEGRDNFLICHSVNRIQVQDDDDERYIWQPSDEYEDDDEDEIPEFLESSMPTLDVPEPDPRIPVARYKLTILVHGENVQPDEREFDAYVRRGKLYFKPYQTHTA